MAVQYMNTQRFAGYHCLCCTQIFSTWVSCTQIFSTMGQDTGSSCMHGTKCGVQDSAAELKNVPQAHLVTRQEHKVLIYHPGTSNTP